MLNCVKMKLKNSHHTTFLEFINMGWDWAKKGTQEESVESQRLFSKCEVLKTVFFFKVNFLLQIMALK